MKPLDSAVLYIYIYIYRYMYIYMQWLSVGQTCWESARPIGSGNIWVVSRLTRGLSCRQICFASRPCWLLAPQDELVEKPPICYRSLRVEHFPNTRVQQTTTIYICRQRVVSTFKVSSVQLVKWSPQTEQYCRKVSHMKAVQGAHHARVLN